MAAMNPDVPKTDLNALQERIDELLQQQDVEHLQSPLDGNQIMEALGLPAGPHVKEAKDFLTNEVIEGRLAADDQVSARRMVIQWWASLGA
jgi:poly(A) polymerase